MRKKAQGTHAALSFSFQCPWPWLSAAGPAGMDENLDCGEPYRGNAYTDAALTRLPETLDESADLLAASPMARSAFGDAVIDFYVHTARQESLAFRNAVTDWERVRYFERI